MNQQRPYDYSTRRGVRPFSWNEFHGLCKALAMVIEPFKPEIILPVGRGGYYPGTLISHILQAEPYPVRLSRRENDVVKHETPRWLVRPPGLIKHRRVLVVDEMCGRGETLTMVKEEAASIGASAVRSAVLYAHSWGRDIPDYIGMVTDELVLNPWDREILRDGELMFHPEYVQALAHQGYEPSKDLLVPAPEFKLEKLH